MKAKEIGCRLIYMEGNLDFYKHAGIVVVSTLMIHYHGEPKGFSAFYFLVQELVIGFLKNIPCYREGLEPTYHTPVGYLVDDANPYDFAAYAATSGSP